MTARTRPTARWRLAAGTSLAVVAASAMTAGVWGSSAHAASISATRISTVGYAINQPLCSTVVRPHEVRCFALKRVEVRKGTPGARAYPEQLPSAAHPSVTSHAIGAGPAGGYTPDDLAAAYKYNPTTERSGQIVGIVDWYNDPHIKSDLAKFEKQYGLHHETASSFRVVNEHGATSPLPSSSHGKSSAGEIALDVETVRSVCNTCRILLVEAAEPSDAAIATAEDTAARLGATEISNSFGGPESQANTTFAKAFNHPGVVVTASTGDDGWFDWDLFNSTTTETSGVAEFPATDPTVVAVGGTEVLLSHTDGHIETQTVWNENGPDDKVGLKTGDSLGAGGGGCSTRFAAPAWQKNVAGYSAVGCKGKRLDADVSAIADPELGFDVYDTWGSTDKGWLTAGGTSLSSPFIAAMYALAGGSGGASYPAFSMYTNAESTPSLVYDVTSGGNGFCGGDTTQNCGNVVSDGTSGEVHQP